MFDECGLELWSEMTTRGRFCPYQQHILILFCIFYLCHCIALWTIVTEAMYDVRESDILLQDFCYRLYISFLKYRILSWSTLYCLRKDPFLILRSTAPCLLSTRQFGQDNKCITGLRSWFSRLVKYLINNESLSSILSWLSFKSSSKNFLQFGTHSKSMI